MLSLLSRWGKGRSRIQRPDVRVVVYSRQSCTCCHKAMDTLREFQDRYGFQLESIDVDTDSELVDQHGLSVPVVEIDGKVRFKGQVNPVLLERLLQAGSQDS